MPNSHERDDTPAQRGKFSFTLADVCAKVWAPSPQVPKELTMRRVMSRRLIWVPAVFVAAAVGVWSTAGNVAVIGQSSILTTTSRKPVVRWFGPFAITKNDTTRFNYWNGGID